MIISISQNPVKARKTALKILRSGGVIVFPTDTVYGIGGDALRYGVNKKLRVLKRRPAEKKFPWLVSDIATAKHFACFSTEVLHVAKKVWPGPVTLVLPKRRSKGNLALRVPAHPWLRRLLAEFGGPIIGTSANISGKKVAMSARAAARLFSQADAVFDGGLIKGRPSRIIDATAERPRTIRR